MPCPQPLGAGACVPQPWPPPLPEGDPRGQGPSRPGPTGRQNFCPERSLRATGVSASQVTQLGGKKLSRTPELVDPNLRSTVPTGEDRAGFACESLGDPSWARLALVPSVSSSAFESLPSSPHFRRRCPPSPAPSPRLVRSPGRGLCPGSTTAGHRAHGRHPSDLCKRGCPTPHTQPGTEWGSADCSLPGWGSPGPQALSSPPTAARSLTAVWGVPWVPGWGQGEKQVCVQ